MTRSEYDSGMRTYDLKINESRLGTHNIQIKKWKKKQYKLTKNKGIDIFRERENAMVLMFM